MHMGRTDTTTSSRRCSPPVSPLPPPLFVVRSSDDRRGRRSWEPDNAHRARVQHRAHGREGRRGLGDELGGAAGRRGALSQRYVSRPLVLFPSSSRSTTPTTRHPDLLGDFVVLFSWRLSRRPPSARYPYGLAKFETIGTTLVALLLLGGALGIGAHSFLLLFATLSETSAALGADALHDALENVTAAAGHLPALLSHAHADAHGEGLLDPNAAWFAAASIVGKEWLFRITRKVAREENSPVLMANAYHHRSDAYTSVVALAAIMGSSWFPSLPLDPIGGVLVSIVILRQGLSIFAGAAKELTDAGASPATLRALASALDPLVAPTPDALVLKVHELRARRAGSQLFVDLAARVPAETDVRRLNEVEQEIVAALKGARRDVKDVTVRFRAEGEE
ncbi:cation efflux family-domain-containing protein [Amylostereum chailletii]|nr:cation efflux family-domain-containing protein [Amylostereum chailletii]